MDRHAMTLLTLIENCDPDNAEMLDEIDRQVYWFLQDYIAWLNENDTKKAISFYEKKNTYNPCCGNCTYICPKENIEYTRSLDAIKAIEPDGYVFTLDAVKCVDGSFAYGAYFMPEDGHHECKYLKTEHLARLHAVIQAIEYERKNENGS